MDFLNCHWYIHHVRLLVSARLIQPANRVFLSQQTSTSQLKPAQKPTSEHADWRRRFPSYGHLPRRHAGTANESSHYGCHVGRANESSHYGYWHWFGHWFRQRCTHSLILPNDTQVDLFLHSRILSFTTTYMNMLNANLEYYFALSFIIIKVDNL